MSGWWEAILGSVIVIFTFFDVVATTLSITRSGPLTHRSVWVLTKLSHSLSNYSFTRHRIKFIYRSIGLIGFTTLFVLWYALIWIGWTLIFASSESSILPSSSSPTPGAITTSIQIYFTGINLFTLGLGDYVANSSEGGFQFLAVLCAATGFILVVITTSYLVSLIAAVSRMRVLADFIGCCLGSVFDAFWFVGVKDIVSDVLMKMDSEMTISDLDEEEKEEEVHTVKSIISPLNPYFTIISSEICSLRQNVITYPLSLMFSLSRRVGVEDDLSIHGRIAVVLEVLVVLRFGVVYDKRECLENDDETEEEGWNAWDAWDEWDELKSTKALWKSIEFYVETLDQYFSMLVDGEQSQSPPLPDLELLRRHGFPVIKDQAEFKNRVENDVKARKMRRVLLFWVRACGLRWDEEVLRGGGRSSVLTTRVVT